MTWLAGSVRLALGVDDLEALAARDPRSIAEAQLSEGDQVDFKLKHDLEASRLERGLAIAEDVAAFANHRGGLLVYGVEEAGGIAQSVPGLDAGPSPEALMNRVRQAVVNYTAPPPNIDTRVVPVPDVADRSVLLVSVPPSAEQPHAVRRGATLDYRVRDGSSSRHLSEHEVAGRYRQRFAGLDEHRAVVAAIAANMEAHAQAAAVPWKQWVWCAVIPHQRTTARSLTKEVVEEVTVWDRDEGFWFPVQDPGWPTGRLLARPRRLQVTDGRHASRREPGALTQEPRSAELWLDGTTSFRHAYLSDEDDLLAETAQGVMPHWWLATVLIVGISKGLLWARHCGSWGTAEVIAGVQLRRGSSLTFDAAPGIDLSEGVSESLIVDLGASVDIPGELAIAAEVAALILQSCGVLSPDCLGLDGTVFKQMWGHAHHHAVEQWASEHGVDTSDFPGPNPMALI